MNRASTDVCGHEFLWTPVSISPGCLPRRGIHGSRDDSMFNVNELPDRSFSRVGTASEVPQQCARGRGPPQCLLLAADLSVATQWCDQVSHCGFDQRFPGGSS